MASSPTAVLAGRLATALAAALLAVTAPAGAQSALPAGPVATPARACANCGTVVSVQAVRARAGWQTAPDSHVALPGRPAGAVATAPAPDGSAPTPPAATARLEGASMAGRPLRYGAAPQALPHPDHAEFDAAAARRSRWETVVRMEDGSLRRFESGVQPTWPIGARVKVVNGIVIPR